MIGKNRWYVPKTGVTPRIDTLGTPKFKIPASGKASSTDRVNFPLDREDSNHLLTDVDGFCDLVGRKFSAIYFL